MKKLLVVLLACALIFAFAACGQQEAPAEEPVAEEAPQTEGMFGLLNLNGMSEDEFNEWYTVNMTPLGAPKGTHVFFDDLNTMMLALDKGDINWFRVMMPTAKYIAAAAPESYTVEEHHYTPNELSMAVAADNTELLSTLNTALEALDADGTLAALEEQYITNCDPANMPAPAELPTFEGAQTVRVVVTGDVPPMDYMTADGKAAGYNIALLSAIAQQAQINFELVSANTSSRMLMVNSGKADAIFWNRAVKYSDAIILSELGDAFVSTTPYLTVNSAMVSKYIPEETEEAPAE